MFKILILIETCTFSHNPRNYTRHLRTQERVSVRIQDVIYKLALSLFHFIFPQQSKLPTCSYPMASAHSLCFYHLRLTELKQSSSIKKTFLQSNALITELYPPFLSVVKIKWPKKDAPEIIVRIYWKRTFLT